MTKATLIKENMYLGWFIVSKVQFTIIMSGNVAAMQADILLEELRVLHLDLKAARRRLSSTGSKEGTFLLTGWSLRTRSLHSLPTQ